MGIFDKHGKVISPDIELHPGEILFDELQARDITPIQLSETSGIRLKTIFDILNRKERISLSIADQLELAIGIKAEFWIGVQHEYDEWWKAEIEKCIQSPWYYFKNYFKIK